MFHRRRFGSQLEMDLAQLCHFHFGQQGLVPARHRKVPPARLDCQRDKSQRDQLFWHIEFYLNTLLIGMHLALFQYSAFDFGVLLPETPEEAHVFQDGRVQPLLEAPVPTLTR